MSERNSAIRDLLFEHGEMKLPDLARRLDVSLATIRRDIAEMAAEGIVARKSGAARIADREVDFAQREEVHLPQKRAIAAAALEMLRPGETVFLDAGTTVLQLAKALRLQPRPLRVFTNGIAVASELTGAPGISLTLLGGRMRPENMSTVGPLALAMLGQIAVDHLFLGASAISDAGEISSFDEDEAQINGAMLARATRRTVLAGSDKFGQRATYRVGALGPGLSLVTERAPEGAAAEGLARSGCEIVIAGRALPGAASSALPQERDYP